MPLSLRPWLLLCTLLVASLLPLQAQTPPQPSAATLPCRAKPEHRQFDFWVGEWDVLAQEKKIATSSIQRIVGECIIFENYTQGDSYTGKSFNFYDATLGRWRQTWVDRTGSVSEFTGEFKENAMHLVGETHRSDGQRILRRMTLFNLGPDRVRQHSERSIDGGQTWSVTYDFIYVRRK